MYPETRYQLSSLTSSFSATKRSYLLMSEAFHL